MTTTDMGGRPADIVSPITDETLANRVSAAEGRAAGRFGYDKPTAKNSIVLLVDHQVGLMTGMRDTTSLAELKSNVIGLARTAKAMDIPTLITSSNAQWQNGDNLPEIKEIFSTEPIYRRTGIINCYEDPTFRKAIEDLVDKTGRRHIIIAAVTIGTCCALCRRRCRQPLASSPETSLTGIGRKRHIVAVAFPLTPPTSAAAPPA